MCGGEGSYQTIEAIHKAVLQQTEKDAMLAEKEWKGVSRQHVLDSFGAVGEPAPAASGIDILVRYVTRAKTLRDAQQAVPGRDRAAA